MQELLAQLLLVLRGAWRYRWPALALSWVIALTGWIIVAMIPDEFEARTRVYVDTESLLRPLLEGIAVDRDVHSQVEMMQRVMLSRANLDRVAREADLYLGSSSPRQREQVLDDLEQRVSLETGTATATVRRKAQQGNDFTVTYADSSPKTAFRVVSALLNTFIEDSLGLKRNDSGVAQQFLKNQLKEYD